MKRFLVAAWFALTLALAFLPGPALADSNDSRSFVLSNELGSTGNQGGLIDRLIAAGHGDDNLYEVLVFLYGQPGTGIPQDFRDSVGNNLAGSDVFTYPLSNFASIANNPICINADGSLHVVSIYGRDYDGRLGFVTNQVDYPGIAVANFTMAESSTYYIDAGDRPAGGRYQAIGIAWERSARSFVISNEAPGYLIDKLIAAGHGSDNLYQVLQFLAAQPGSGIPADFVTEVGNSAPGSDVFTATLNDTAPPANNPFGINADGTTITAV